MNEMDVDWDNLQLFLAVARGGGLSAAAKLTQRSPATLGRRMNSLERKMQCELFIRHDRGYELTTEGKVLLAGLTEIESSVFRLTTRVTDKNRPLVKVSAGTWTTLVLIQHLERLTGTPPDIRIRFVSAEDVLNISHREVVIGIRNRRPTDNNLVCRKLGRVDFAPYATANAIKQWIKVINDTPSARWVDRVIRDEVAYEVNAPRNSLDLALAGKGIALLPTFIGDTQAGLLRRGEPIAELSHDQWLVTHQEDRKLPEVRCAIDRISDVLQHPGK